MASHRLLNVSLTRARYGLVCIGNRQDSDWDCPSVAQMVGQGKVVRGHLHHRWACFSEVAYFWAKVSRGKGTPGPIQRFHF